MLKPKYKAVIFDFDDTLAESRELKWAHHKDTAKTFYDLDLTDEDIGEHYGKPMDKMLAGLYRGIDTLENIYENLISLREKYLKKVYTGSLETVNKIMDNGVLVGIISATQKRYLVDDLERMGFPVDKFFHLQAADETDVHKPDGGVFTPVFNKLKERGIEKKDVVYVGDSMIDFEATKNAGIDFVAVTTGLYSESDFKNAGAKIIINNIAEVLEFI